MRILDQAAAPLFSAAARQRDSSRSYVRNCRCDEYFQASKRNTSRGLIMKKTVAFTTLCLAFGLHALAAPPAKPPRPASAPVPAASAASAASAVPAPAAALPSPAVRAAEEARMPGELKPEQPVIPQITVPLSRNSELAKPVRTSQVPVAAGSVDDSTARCRAIAQPQERAASRPP